MTWRFASAALFAISVTTVACATTGFSSTWRNPDAQPLEPQGVKVAAVVMSKNESTRRAAEDALAKAITAQGAQGVPMYTVSSATEEAAQKAALEQAGFEGVVVMRPTGTSREITATPTMYAGPYYAGYWGGYYGYGWGTPWGGTDIRTDTIVTVETLVYSLKQNKLVWAGQSKTTNPSKVDGFVREVASAASRELRKEGLLPKKQ
ncbi:MAG TPA: hypothetical protein VJP86_03195 [Vicinamibacterales bacterium]|jgi:hypothetical protein|nr:hypothetical protein [Vicinamibacterales bacterium]